MGEKQKTILTFTAKIGSQFRVIIPPYARDILNLKEGDYVIIHAEAWPK